MVKTNAPGAFSCEIYLKAWLMGDRRPGCDVMEHIDNCWFCRDIVHGGSEEFPLSIEDEARQNIARRGRRDFLRYAAAVVGGLSLAGMGVASFYGGAPSNAQLAIDKELKRIDRRYYRGGNSYITKRLQKGTKPEIKLIMRWIEDRRHSAHYWRLVDFLSHSDPELRSVAVSRLLSIPPIDLRPHASQIDAVRTSTSSSSFQSILGLLMSRIAGS